MDKFAQQISPMCNKASKRITSEDLLEGFSPFCWVVSRRAVGRKERTIGKVIGIVAWPGIGKACRCIHIKYASLPPPEDAVRCQTRLQSILTSSALPLPLLRRAFRGATLQCPVSCPSLQGPSEVIFQAGAHGRRARPGSGPGKEVEL